MGEVTGARRTEVERLASMPDDQQDEHLLSLEPSERAQVLRDVERVQAEEGGFFSRALAPLTSRWRANERSSELSDRAIKESSSDDTEYVQGVNSPNANYLAIDHKELKRQSVDDNEPGAVGQASTGYSDLKSGYESMHESLLSAVKTLRSSWEGEASDQATTYVDGLARYSEANTRNAQLASELVYQQSEASSTFKNAMPEPVPFSMQEEMSKARTADSPWAAMAIVVGAEAKQAQSRAAHEQAARVAETFEQNTFASASKQPVFAEPPKFGSGGGSDPSGSGRAGGGIGGSATGPSVGGSGGTSAAGYAGGPAGSSGGATTAPSVQTPSGPGALGGGGLPPGAVRLPDGSIRYPDGTVVKPDGTKVLPDGTVVKPDGTRIMPDGTVIPPGTTSSAGFGSSGLESGVGMAAGFGPTGGGAGGAGAAGMAGGAAGGLGAGSGGLGAGKGSGVGSGFGPTGSGAGGLKGAGGMGGRGMGGMMGGAGAGGAKGDDEKEHQDKYYVKQELDPGMHVEYDEFGEKLIDETTGFTVVPPVIGE